mmetsp:Transcript_40703/g.79845  ORF Transcript_40703/g.79845 Transcript_40703/m.79845 type:complete len:578 (+) Transcript_40703:1776-3509(+)
MVGADHSAVGTWFPIDSECECVLSLEHVVESDVTKLDRWHWVSRRRAEVCVVVEAVGPTCHHRAPIPLFAARPTQELHHTHTAVWPVQVESPLVGTPHLQPTNCRFAHYRPFVPVQTTDPSRIRRLALCCSVGQQVCLRGVHDASKRGQRLPVHRSEDSGIAVAVPCGFEHQPLGARVQIPPLHIVHHILGSAQNTSASSDLAVLVGAHSTPSTPGKLCIFKHEGPQAARAQEQPNPPHPVVSAKYRIFDVDSAPVGEVLGALPVHAVVVVDGVESEPLDISQVVLPHQVVEEVQPVNYRRDVPVVVAVVFELLTRGPSVRLVHVRDVDHIPVAGYAALQLPRPVVVEVETEPSCAVVDVPFHPPERGMHGADLALGRPFAPPKSAGLREKPVVSACKAVTHPVVGHRQGPAATLLHVICLLVVSALHSTAVLVGGVLRAHHDIVFERVVHLVPVFHVDACTFDTPDDVALHQSVVRTVHHHTSLERLCDEVPPEEAPCTALQQVQVQAIPSKHTALPALLYLGVRDADNSSRMCYRVQALLSDKIVPGDEDVAAEVHHLRLQFLGYVAKELLLGGG